MRLRCPVSAKWYGTSMTMVFGRKSSASLSRSAVWLWRIHSHQFLGTNSARTIVIDVPYHFADTGHRSRKDDESG